jgi:pimeloyl-ACP methyl ester carboxylesterase
LPKAPEVRTQDHFQPNSEQDMQTSTHLDGTEPFTVSVHHSPANSRLVLFAAGAGGLPERYSTLLNTLVAAGCTVVAPHFERLASPFPTDEELRLRARRLSLSLNAFAQPGTVVAGVGHSIGASTLLALSGAQMWLGPGRQLAIGTDARLSRLALLTAPLGFFQAPGALDAVRVPLQVWAGSEDTMTLASQAQWLAETLRVRLPVDLRIASGAGHFSFMDAPPPHAVETVPDKAAFLEEYSREVCRFVLQQPTTGL